MAPRLQRGECRHSSPLKMPAPPFGATACDQSKSRLLSMPIELLLEIPKNLNDNDTICLALSCKITLLKLGKATSKPDPPKVSFDEVWKSDFPSFHRECCPCHISLLRQLGPLKPSVDTPGYALCYDCGKYMPQVEDEYIIQLCLRVRERNLVDAILDGGKREDITLALKADVTPDELEQLEWHPMFDEVLEASDVWFHDMSAHRPSCCVEKWFVDTGL